jgi:DNA-binding CsgD family transcriptional regulator
MGKSDKSGPEPSREGRGEKIRVRFAVEDDEQANKITALLEALGYEAVRELDHGSPQTRLRWAVARLANAAKLTDRERDILDRVLQGRLNSEIGEELGISKATVKWHMHNIFTKTGATTREALLREALQLGLPQPSRDRDDDDD